MAIQVESASLDEMGLNMKFSQRVSSVILVCASMLTACGGGGGSAGTSSFAPPSTTATAADLDISASAVQLPNTSAASVTITVTALDSGKSALSDASVKISVASGSDAFVTQPTLSTNAQGQVTATVSVGSNKANRSVTINATSGSITKSTTLQVVGATVTGTVLPPVLSPGAQGTVRYRVVDQATNPMVNQSVQISSVGLNPASVTGTTDLNGEYLFSYTAPTVTGAYVIAASISGVSNQQTVNVQAANTVPEVTSAITSASVSASPSVVAVNTSGNQNRSEIRALFLGLNNAPIKNVRVRFDLNGDSNSIGGVFNNGNAILYSDSNGIATAAYIPGSRPSPTNGLTVRACYGKTDGELDNGACPNAAMVSLTIVNDPLGVSIGTNELISSGDANLTYIKQYIVSVVDAAGNAKQDVNLSVSVDLPWYYKGRYCVGSAAPGSTCLGSGWVWQPVAVCANEDTNRNGVLEGSSEDVNGNARLDPGKSDVTIRLLQAKTGVDGLAVLQIEYPKNYASWVAANITVAASGVSGTEGRASYLQDPVPVPTDQVKSTDSTPAFVVSPYGQDSSCTSPL